MKKSKKKPKSPKLALKSWLVNYLFYFSLIKCVNLEIWPHDSFLGLMWPADQFQFETLALRHQFLKSDLLHTTNSCRSTFNVK